MAVFNIIIEVSIDSPGIEADSLELAKDAVSEDVHSRINSNSIVTIISCDEKIE